jgi:hypothetical protein
MGVRLRSWWQKIKQQPLVAILAFVGIMAGIAGIALIVVAVLGYWLNWHWTGLVAETSEPKQHAKTLWDWLGLIAILGIPVMVGFGAALFTAQQAKVSAWVNTDNQREAALQAYINEMSELLLHEKLRESAEDDEVRTIARVRTLTVLRGLDPIRKASVIQFLHESGLIAYSFQHSISSPLIDKDKCIINLVGADLVGANLSDANLAYAVFIEADLRHANLSKATLEYTNFSEAFLFGTNLSEAYLGNANLNDANLGQANLSGAFVENEQLAKVKFLAGATMPDGTKHP